MNTEGSEKEEEEYSDTVPSSHALIDITQLVILEHKAQLHDNFIKRISSNAYVGMDVGNNMLVLVHQVYLMLTMQGLQELPFVIGSFLLNCGIHCKTRQLVNSLPSNVTIKRALKDNTVSNKEEKKLRT